MSVVGCVPLSAAKLSTVGVVLSFLGGGGRWRRLVWACFLLVTSLLLMLHLLGQRPSSRCFLPMVWLTQPFAGLQVASTVLPAWSGHRQVSTCFVVGAFIVG